MTPLERVLDRLRELEFSVQPDRNELFGQPLPYLKAIATDGWAHQLVLVAEEERLGEGPAAGEAEDQAWRELIFAVAGLRHHLRGPCLPALGPPVLLALVDGRGRSDLRRIVEEIAKDYALFSRVDINLVDVEWTAERERLDSAITSLLPRVREAIRREETVASQDVERFWEELNTEVHEEAKGLVGAFGPKYAAASPQRLEMALQAWWEQSPAHSSDDADVLPLHRIELENFRSFDQEEVVLPRVGIVHGANGSGKTSLCEAMEILWSGRTSRMPEDVKTKVYEDHLKRDGKGFCLKGDLGGDVVTRTEVSAAPLAPLGRTVLPQHAIKDMAGSNPRERYRAFLTAAGLELSGFGEMVDQWRRRMLEDANSALVQAGMESISAVNKSGLGHLAVLLGEGDFAAELPSHGGLQGSADALGAATDGSYAPKDPLLRIAPEVLRGLLSEADAALAQVHDDLDRAPDPSPRVEAALTALRAESEHLTALGVRFRQLADHLDRIGADQDGQDDPGKAPAPLVPPQAAAFWLAHVRGVQRGIPQLRALRAKIGDEHWKKRLETYVAALDQAVQGSSVVDLEAMVDSLESNAPRSSQAAGLSSQLLEQAGFVRAPEPSVKVRAAIREMHSRVSEYAAALDRLTDRLDRHPAPRFIAKAARIMPALCDFELARALTKPTGALTRARGKLVNELLDNQLMPIVQELVAALVRFEWYFDAPLKVTVKGQELRFSGLSSENPGLDIRMMLNEAERTAVGIAWFLALHILQPAPSRQVLVLDDPASGFDDTNKASFTATLRSVLHMLKPKQFLITTHDEAAVALFEQEFAEVGGWPPEFVILRCSRTEAGTSAVRHSDDKAQGADLERELRMLAFDQGGLHTLA